MKVCTVDGYQGKEADYVVISTCAQKDSMSGHLAQMERACVATSRGKFRLIILGNRAVLQTNALWRAILRRMKHVEGNVCCDEAVR